MNKIIVSIILTCVFLMISCGVYFPRTPKSVKKSFTYCFDGKYTGIDTLLNIDGYYSEMSIEKNSQTIGGFLKDTSIYNVDTTYGHFMFYDNGLFVYNLRNIYYDDRGKKWIKKDDVSMFLKDFSENTEAPGANYFYGNDWGSYIICGDTLKMQVIYKGVSLNDSWFLREYWYKIINKSTILCINTFSLPTHQVTQPKSSQNPLTFVPASSKPPPDKSWILKEKWFWCNEADWKAHKEQLKKR